MKSNTAVNGINNGVSFICDSFLLQKNGKITMKNVRMKTKNSIKIK
jgi:hypothetical protein